MQKVTREKQLRNVTALAIEMQRAFKDLHRFEIREQKNGKMDSDAIKEKRLQKQLSKSESLLIEYCKYINLNEDEFYSIDVLYMSFDGISFDDFIKN